jgi:AcrR family transcriptional regulator
MTDQPGLRERKKLRTRALLSEIALRRFAEQGVDATTVEEICAEAEVSPSTFFRYFAVKEAAAFPDEEQRLAVVEDALRSRTQDEPLHAAIRRAALALVDHDLERRRELRARVALMGREPALAAYAWRLQTASSERLVAIVAEQLGVDPRADLRPRVTVGMSLAAMNSAWTAWIGGKGDLRALVSRACDLLDGGLQGSLP